MSNVDVSKNIEKRINDWKKSLLDMTKRNRLLWYKPYKTGSLKLEKDIFDSEVKDILDELNKLAFGGHTIEFSTEIEIANEQELPLLEYDEKKKKDRNEIVKNRTKTLYAINKRIKLENEEKGLNIGYIAVGFLEWYESDDANSKVKSPLVLIPIKTEQDGRRDPLRISLNTNEEITFNPVVKKKLESDFNLIFDIDPQNYETPSIQKILEQIKKITKNQLNWRVLNEAVIDTFNFQNLAIWHDLDKNAKLVIDNSFSRVLAGSELGDEGFVFEKEPDLDKTKARNNINIFEVDSSQQEAIYRARNGESFVIQGPPGTGKSQTITNIIAESLYLGKKVLFVSEKQAALDVVYHKLEEKNLADFCLILHNSKQRKSDVRKQIASSLNLSQKHLSITESAMLTYENFDKERKKLNLYTEKLHEQFDDGTTPYFLIGELSKLREVKDLNFDMPDDFDWDANYNIEIAELFSKVESYGMSFIDDSRHFDTNYWQYYIGQFSNSTRREVQEKIGDINKDILNARIKFIKDLAKEGNKREILKKCKEYLANIDKIPFKQAKHDEIDKNIKQIEDLEADNVENQKIIKKLAKDINNKKAELLNTFSEDFLNFKKSDEFYKKLTNKFNSFFSRLSSDYRMLIKKLDKYTLKKLKYNDFVKYLDILQTINKNADTIRAVKGKINSNSTCLNNKYSELVNILESKNNSVKQLLDKLDFNLMQEYQNYLASRKILLDEYNLASFVEKIEDKKYTFKSDDIKGIFKKRFITISLEMTDFDKEYSNYSRQSHNRDVDIFREYDKENLKVSAARIRCKLINGLPVLSSFTNKTRGGEVQLLSRELKKKSRLMPTRKLIENLPILLPQLKPCMMMSPLTVSSYFGMNPNWKFDIVIFDEASQVKPEYAITSIIRGKQVIVAGDSKQMPPTNFFDTVGGDDEYDDENTQLDNLESVLDEMSSFFPDVYLNWHYRSKDESLIAFSNHKFYNSRLATFPSPVVDSEQVGVNFIYCENGLWESRNGNRPEAEKVALLVFDHIEKHPEQSLGVVAFGKSQEYAIDEAINKLRDLYPEKEDFFSDLNREPFFIKNLENVQGDERDRIILSCGYGKDTSGTFAMRFGPLATTGGERRLNVAISRAKRSMTVVSSFRANEIRGVENNSQRRLIRDFIDYAERGTVTLLGDDAVGDDHLEFDSGFEEDVYNFLKNKGYKLCTQVGSSGYKIDIVVKHPKIEGRYILAIECDGATYHSSRTARDRDILRQEILENLGWRFYRIWSTDWFHDNENEKNRLLKAVKIAQSLYDEPNSASSNFSTPKLVNEGNKIIEASSDSTEQELSIIYNTWKVALKKRFGDGTFNEYNNWSNRDGWNSLYVMEHYDIIEKIIDQILKYKNGFSPEDIFREINEKVFEKTRYTSKAKRIYNDGFRRNFIDKGRVEIVNNSIRVKAL